MPQAIQSGQDVTALMGGAPIDTEFAPRDVLSEGRRSAATSGTPEAASWLAERWAELRPQLERVAHPETLADIANLLIPDAAGVAVGARAAARAAGKATEATGKGLEAVGVSAAAKAASGYGAATALLHGDVKNAALMGGAPPLARATGRGLQQVGQALQRAGERPLPAAAAIPEAVAPVETPPASAAPAPSPAPATAAGSTPPMSVGKILKTLQTEGGLSPAEANQALKWAKEGVGIEGIHQRIEQARALKRTGAFAKLPTADEVAAAVKKRNETGSWE